MVKNYKEILNDKLNREYLFARKRHWKDHKITLQCGIIIKNRKQTIKRDYKVEYTIGFDIETLKGTCKLLCDSNKRHILNPTFKECLDFLSYKYKQPNGYRFFFNIDFDISSILKLLPKKFMSFIDNLSKGKTVIYSENNIMLYEIRWIRSKMFILTKLNIKTKRSVIFTDIYTFFHMSLDNVGKTYINDKKLDIIDKKRINKSLNYWKKNEKNIINYCIQDCILTKEIGNYLINDIVIDAIKCLPRNLVSPASMSKHYFRLNCDLPEPIKTPRKVLNISYSTYRGGRFELLKRGTFKEVFHYDVNSEYPKVESELPDLRDGVWRLKRNMKKLPKRETLGFFNVLANIPPKELISTIPYLKKNDVIKYPSGKFLINCTWYDLDLIRDYITKIRRAYIFYPQENCRFPLKEKIEELYKYKSKYKKKNVAKYKGGKLTMNAEYGCFIETNKVYINDVKTLLAGIMFNPVYATTITAKGRWLIIKDIPKKEWKNIIGFHTDSIDSEISLNKYLDIGNKLGQWSLEGKGKGIFLNTGMYQINDSKGKIFKSRGIPKIFINDWFDFCKKYKNLNKKTFLIKHMLKIREAIVHNIKFNFNQINTFQDIKRTISVDNDTKRSWKGKFNNFNEMSEKNISSLPLIMDLNNKIKFNYI